MLKPRLIYKLYIYINAKEKNEILQNKVTATYVYKGGNNDSHGTTTLMTLPTYICRSQVLCGP